MTAASARPGIAQRLGRMIRVRTVSAQLEHTGAAPFEEFRGLLRELYPLVHERLALEPIGELGLLYRWKGVADAAPVVLMAHYDVVPVGPDDAWTHDPFGGELVADSVWGRGAIDDKGALCVLLDAVENLLAAGFVPPRDVYLSLGGDEETASASARLISATLQARGIAPWLVLDEGGAIVDGILPGVDAPAAVVGVAEKGALSVRITAREEPGHASTPSAHATAVDRIARAVARVRRNPFPKRFNAVSRTMFRRSAPRAHGVGRIVTKVIPALGPLGARLFARLGGEPAAMVQTTIATTLIEAGTAVNVIPAQASATFDIRIALGESVSGALATLQRTIADPRIEYEVLGGNDPSPTSTTENAQWDLIEKAVGAGYPGTLTLPYVMLAQSDAWHFHHLAPEATYRLAPLAMSREQRRGLHGIDERVTVDALLRGEVFYRTLISSLPG